MTAYSGIIDRLEMQPGHEWRRQMFARVLGSLRVDHLQRTAGSLRLELDFAGSFQGDEPPGCLIDAFASHREQAVILMNGCLVIAKCGSDGITGVAVDDNG